MEQVKYNNSIVEVDGVVGKTQIERGNKDD